MSVPWDQRWIAAKIARRRTGQRLHPTEYSSFVKLSSAFSLTFVLRLDGADTLNAALELGLCCFELSKRRREVLHLCFQLLLDLEKLSTVSKVGAWDDKAEET